MIPRALLQLLHSVVCTHLSRNGSTSSSTANSSNTHGSLAGSMKARSPNELNEQERQAAITAFEGLGLCTQLAEAAAGLGWKQPSVIQQQAVPPLIQGEFSALSAAWRSCACVCMSLQPPNQTDTACCIGAPYISMRCTPWYKQVSHCGSLVCLLCHIIRRAAASSG